MNRDSYVLTLAAIGALVGYLVADGRIPLEWGYADWLKAIAFAIAWISGKLATSPLAGAPKE
jgi:hypothetical protein